MATFSYNLSGLVLTISLTGGTWGTYYRFFVRYANNASSVVYDNDHYCPQSGRISVDIDLKPNTSYALNAGAINGNSTSWYWGSGPIVTTGSGSGGGGGNTPAPVRPSNWYWWSIIASGAQISISAAEWNAFTARINDFRNYKGLSYYWFSAVSSGQAISYWIANQAVNGIADIPGRGYMIPSVVNAGDPITASFFLNLQNSLNAIY